MSVPDRGLQPQRTALAWSRTGLALFVNALLVLRSGIQAERISIVLLGIVLLAGAAMSVVYGTWRIRHLATPGGLSTPPWIVIAATVWVTWIACFAGVVSMLVTLP